MGGLIAVSVGNAGGGLAVGCFEGEKPQVAALPAGHAAAVAAMLAGRSGWTGRHQDVLRGSAGDASAIAVYGLGKRTGFSERTLALWLARVAADAEADCAERLTVALPDHPAAAGEAGAARAARALALAGYRFDRYKSVSPERRLQAVGLLTLRGGEAAAAEGVRVGALVAAAVAYARDLANAPPNEATPEWMAEQARSLAGEKGFAVEVLEPAELAARGMGGILAVGGGSAHPPRLVRLEWGEGKGRIALVGKGVTFDTGGISIKPAAAMEEMKWDKCGACTVLGLARAVADLRLPGRFQAYLPLAENMLGGAAYRPGDIVRCANRKTVEIVNTDAEGRMILADALAWAAAEKPDVLLEYSTLTGGCVVALGHSGAGLYTPDDGLAEGLLAAARETGERLWRLPLWEEFSDEMKGSHADLKNSAGRFGSANTAAAFLAAFMDGAARWAHLDIAGPAYVGADQKGPRGATGFGIALSLSWLRRELEPPGDGRSPAVAG